MRSYLFQIKVATDRILRRLDKIEVILQAVVREIRRPRGPVQVYVNDSSKKTLDALKSLHRPASAAEVAAVTGRSRASESAELNVLWRSGVVEKTRRGRIEKLFSLKEEYCDKR